MVNNTPRVVNGQQGRSQGGGGGGTGVCPPPRKSGIFLINPNVDCRKNVHSFSFLINYRSSDSKLK